MTVGKEVKNQLQDKNIENLDLIDKKIELN